MAKVDSVPVPFLQKVLFQKIVEVDKEMVQSDSGIAGIRRVTKRGRIQGEPTPIGKTGIRKKINKSFCLFSPCAYAIVSREGE